MIVALLLALVLIVAALAWVRPRAFSPKLDPRDWTRGGDDAL